MNRLFLTVITFLVIFPVSAQRKCGFDAIYSSISAKNPAFPSYFASKQEGWRQIAIQRRAEKHTSTSTSEIYVPIVFHIVVNEAQYEQMGGKWGIEQRCLSQVQVLNEDFNAQNADSSLIPSGWKPLFGNVGIHFGLAHTDPYGYPTPGYTVRITDRSGFYGLDNSYDTVKKTNLGGSDAWNVNYYINVWCLNFLDLEGLLGVTLSRTLEYNNGGDTSDIGICILYNTLGRTMPGVTSFPINKVDSNYFNLGRTLTHEMGHYFEIWHVWGDDGGLCPWPANTCSNNGGRSVLPDLPPQGNYTFYNPVYSIPGGTVYDICNDSCSTTDMQPIGIACLSYLDYTDDQGMHLFTPDQASVMRSQVEDATGESFSLTQKPTLFSFPVGAPQQVTLFPNPCSRAFTIFYTDQTDTLQRILIMDLAGNQVFDYPLTDGYDRITNSYWYNVSVAGIPPGVYFVKLKFKKATITQKLNIQN